MIGFSSILSLNETKTRLTNAALRKRVPHAQLFTGIDGGAALGTALAFAKYMACDSPKPQDSCNSCQSCLQFEHFNYPDIHFSFPFSKSQSKNKDPNCIEFRKAFSEALAESLYLTHSRWLEKMDVANQQVIIPVQEARSIIHNLSIKAFSSKPRFIVIWQPELLHKSAANKLLKSLEEPGANTYFFLVSHKPETLLGTIKSRCVTVKIPLHKDNEIAAHLTELGVEPEKATALSLNADGSIGFAEDSVKRLTQHEFAADLFVKWARYLYTKNIAELISWSEELSRQYREEIKFFIEYATRIFRQSFMINNNTLTNAPFQHQSFNVEKFAPFIPVAKIDIVMDLLERAKTDIERNGNPKIVLLDLSLNLAKHVG